MLSRRRQRSLQSKDPDENTPVSSSSEKTNTGRKCRRSRRSLVKQLGEDESVQPNPVNVSSTATSLSPTGILTNNHSPEDPIDEYWKRKLVITEPTDYSTSIWDDSPRRLVGCRIVIDLNSQFMDNEIVKTSKSPNHKKNNTYRSRNGSLSSEATEDSTTYKYTPGTLSTGLVTRYDVKTGRHYVRIDDFLAKHKRSAPRIPLLSGATSPTKSSPKKRRSLSPRKGLKENGVESDDIGIPLKLHHHWCAVGRKLVWAQVARFKPHPGLLLEHNPTSRSIDGDLAERYTFIEEAQSGFTNTQPVEGKKREKKKPKLPHYPVLFFADGSISWLPSQRISHLNPYTPIPAKQKLIISSTAVRRAYKRAEKDAETLSIRQIMRREVSRINSFFQAHCRALKQKYQEYENQKHHGRSKKAGYVSKKQISAIIANFFSSRVEIGKPFMLVFEDLSLELLQDSEKRAGDKMSSDKMSGDKVSGDKLSGDKTQTLASKIMVPYCPSVLPTDIISSVIRVFRPRLNYPHGMYITARVCRYSYTSGQHLLWIQRFENTQMNTSILQKDELYRRIQLFTLDEIHEMKSLDKRFHDIHVEKEEPYSLEGEEKYSLGEQEEEEGKDHNVKALYKQRCEMSKYITPLLKGAESRLVWLDLRNFIWQITTPNDNENKKKCSQPVAVNTTQENQNQSQNHSPEEKISVEPEPVPKSDIVVDAMDIENSNKDLKASDKSKRQMSPPERIPGGDIMITTEDNTITTEDNTITAEDNTISVGDHTLRTGKNRSCSPVKSIDTLEPFTHPFSCAHCGLAVMKLPPIDVHVAMNYLSKRRKSNKTYSSSATSTSSTSSVASASSSHKRKRGCPPKKRRDGKKSRKDHHLPAAEDELYSGMIICASPTSMEENPNPNLNLDEGKGGRKEKNGLSNTKKKRSAQSDRVSNGLDSSCNSSVESSFQQASVVSEYSYESAISAYFAAQQDDENVCNPSLPPPVCSVCNRPVHRQCCELQIQLVEEDEETANDTERGDKKGNKKRRTKYLSTAPIRLSEYKNFVCLDCASCHGCGSRTPVGKSAYYTEKKITTATATTGSGKDATVATNSTTKKEKILCTTQLGEPLFEKGNLPIDQVERPKKMQTMFDRARWFFDYSNSIEKEFAIDRYTRCFEIEKVTDDNTNQENKNHNGSLNENGPVPPSSTGVGKSNTKLTASSTSSSFGNGTTTQMNNNNSKMKKKKSTADNLKKEKSERTVGAFFPSELCTSSMTCFCTNGTTTKERRVGKKGLLGLGASKKGNAKRNNSTGRHRRRNGGIPIRSKHFQLNDPPVHYGHECFRGTPFYNTLPNTTKMTTNTNTNLENNSTSSGISSVGVGRKGGRRSGRRSGVKGKKKSSLQINTNQDIMRQRRHELVTEILEAAEMGSATKDFFSLYGYGSPVKNNKKVHKNMTTAMNGANAMMSPLSFGMDEFQTNDFDLHSFASSSLNSSPNAKSAATAGGGFGAFGRYRSTSQMRGGLINSDINSYPHSFSNENNVFSSPSNLLASIEERASLLTSTKRLCNRCHAKYQCHEHCGQCGSVWDDESAGSMIECDGCGNWVHALCEGMTPLSYRLFVQSAHPIWNPGNKLCGKLSALNNSKSGSTKGGQHQGANGTATVASSSSTTGASSDASTSTTVADKASNISTEWASSLSNKDGGLDSASIIETTGHYHCSICRRKAMLQCLEALATKDSKYIFMHPVTPEMAPDYSKVIAHPIDLTQIYHKILDPGLFPELNRWRRHRNLNVNLNVNTTGTTVNSTVNSEVTGASKALASISGGSDWGFVNDGATSLSSYLPSYVHLQSFRDDIELLCYNALIFNPAHTQIWTYAWKFFRAAEITLNRFLPFTRRGRRGRLMCTTMEKPRTWTLPPPRFLFRCPDSVLTCPSLHDLVVRSDKELVYRMYTTFMKVYHGVGDQTRDNKEEETMAIEPQNNNNTTEESLSTEGSSSQQDEAGQSAAGSKATVETISSTSTMSTAMPPRQITEGEEKRMLAELMKKEEMMLMYEDQSQPLSGGTVASSDFGSPQRQNERRGERDLSPRKKLLERSDLINKKEDINNDTRVGSREIQRGSRGLRRAPSKTEGKLPDRARTALLWCSPSPKASITSHSLSRSLLRQSVLNHTHLPFTDTQAAMQTLSLEVCSICGIPEDQHSTDPGQRFRVCIDCGDTFHEACVAEHQGDSPSLRLCRNLGFWRCPNCVVCRACGSCTLEDEKDLLVCEGCGEMFHTFCVIPKLKSIPINKWYCGICVDMCSKKGSCLRNQRNANQDLVKVARKSNNTTTNNNNNNDVLNQCKSCNPTANLTASSVPLSTKSSLGSLLDPLEWSDSMANCQLCRNREKTLIKSQRQSLRERKRKLLQSELEKRNQEKKKRQDETHREEMRKTEIEKRVGGHNTNQCPVCTKTWGDEDMNMACCDNCGNWVHMRCDPVALGDTWFLWLIENCQDEDFKYICPMCRPERTLRHVARLISLIQIQRSNTLLNIQQSGINNTNCDNNDTVDRDPNKTITLGMKTFLTNYHQNETKWQMTYGRKLNHFINLVNKIEDVIDYGTIPMSDYRETPSTVVMSSTTKSSGMTLRRSLGLVFPASLNEKDFKFENVLSDEGDKNESVTHPVSFREVLERLQTSFHRILAIIRFHHSNQTSQIFVNHLGKEKSRSQTRHGVTLVASESCSGKETTIPVNLQRHGVSNDSTNVSTTLDRTHGVSSLLDCSRIHLQMDSARYGSSKYDIERFTRGSLLNFSFEQQYWKAREEVSKACSNSNGSNQSHEVESDSHSNSNQQSQGELHSSRYASEFNEFLAILSRHVHLRTCQERYNIIKKKKMKKKKETFSNLEEGSCGKQQYVAIKREDGNPMVTIEGNDGNNEDITDSLKLSHSITDLEQKGQEGMSQRLKSPKKSTKGTTRRNKKKTDDDDFHKCVTNALDVGEYISLWIDVPRFIRDIHSVWNSKAHLEEEKEEKLPKSNNSTSLGLPANKLLDALKLSSEKKPTLAKVSSKKELLTIRRGRPSSNGKDSRTETNTISLDDLNLENNFENENENLQLCTNLLDFNDEAQSVHQWKRSDMVSLHVKQAYLQYKSRRKTDRATKQREAQQKHKDKKLKILRRENFYWRVSRLLSKFLIPTLTWSPSGSQLGPTSKGNNQWTAIGAQDPCLHGMVNRIEEIWRRLMESEMRSFLQELKIKTTTLSVKSIQEEEEKEGLPPNASLTTLPPNASLITLPATNSTNINKKVQLRCQFCGDGSNRRLGSLVPLVTRGGITASSQKSSNIFCQNISLPSSAEDPVVQVGTIMKQQGNTFHAVANVVGQQPDTNSVGGGGILSLHHQSLLSTPVRSKSHQVSTEWVHEQCALFSAEVFESNDGILVGVAQARERSMNLSCAYCGKKGASLGCAHRKCGLNFHLECAIKAQCEFVKIFSTLQGQSLPYDLLDTDGTIDIEHTQTSMIDNSNAKPTCMILCQGHKGRIPGHMCSKVFDIDYEALEQKEKRGLSTSSSSKVMRSNTNAKKKRKGQNTISNTIYQKGIPSTFLPHFYCLPCETHPNTLLGQPVKLTGKKNDQGNGTNDHTAKSTHEVNEGQHEKSKTSHEKSKTTESSIQIRNVNVSEEDSLNSMEEEERHNQTQTEPIKPRPSLEEEERGLIESSQNYGVEVISLIPLENKKFRPLYALREDMNPDGDNTTVSHDGDDTSTIGTESTLHDDTGSMGNAGSRNNGGSRNKGKRNSKRSSRSHSDSGCNGAGATVTGDVSAITVKQTEKGLDIKIPPSLRLRDSNGRFLTKEEQVSLQGGDMSGVVATSNKNTGGSALVSSGGAIASSRTSSSGQTSTTDGVTKGTKGTKGSQTSKSTTAQTQTVPLPMSYPFPANSEWPGGLRVGSLLVANLGAIRQENPDASKHFFHTRECVYPPGYTAFRRHWSIDPGKPWSRDIYRMRILDPFSNPSESPLTAMTVLEIQELVDDLCIKNNTVVGNKNNRREEGETHYHANKIGQQYNSRVQRRTALQKCLFDYAKNQIDEQNRGETMTMGSLSQSYALPSFEHVLLRPRPLFVIDTFHPHNHPSKLAIASFSLYLTVQKVQQRISNNQRRFIISLYQRVRAKTKQCICLPGVSSSNLTSKEEEVSKETLKTGKRSNASGGLETTSSKGDATQGITKTLSTGAVGQHTSLMNMSLVEQQAVQTVAQDSIDFDEGEDRLMDLFDRFQARLFTFRAPPRASPIIDDGWNSYGNCCSQFFGLTISTVRASIEHMPGFLGVCLGRQPSIRYEPQFRKELARYAIELYNITKYWPEKNSLCGKFISLHKYKDKSVPSLTNLLLGASSLDGNTRTTSYNQTQRNNKPTKKQVQMLKLARKRERLARMEREEDKRRRNLTSGKLSSAIGGSELKTHQKKKSKRRGGVATRGDRDDKDSSKAKTSGSDDRPLATLYRALKDEPLSSRVEVRRSRIHGWGLFAKRYFPPGEMVVEYVGELIRMKEADIREELYEKQGMGSCYMFRLNDSHVVDATTKGNVARFMNHSCEPNAVAKVISFFLDEEIRRDGESQEDWRLRAKVEKLVIVADETGIFEGEEVQYDYKFPLEEGPSIACNCGAPSCIGRMN
eukprot:g838.t1